MSLVAVLLIVQVATVALGWLAARALDRELDALDESMDRLMDRLGKDTTQ